MDSGNSGSMQSSSGGGDDEYDSRSESISSFLNPSAHYGSIPEAAPATPPLLPHHQPPPPTTLFSHHLPPPPPPHSHNNLDNTFPQSLPYTTPHHDLVWSRGLRSDPTNNNSNYANFANIPSSSSTQSLQNVQSLPHHQSIEANAPAKAAAAQSDQPNTVKNPKKRTRASRRAPTTVLTTDTTNFRQMVQEFTGIPTAPFSGSGSPYSRRLDLFSTGTSSNLRSAPHLDFLGGGPLYPLRPSAQKVHQFSSPSSFLNSSNLIDSLVSSAANPGNNSNLIPSVNILNMQNQMLSFQVNNNNGTSIPSFLQNPSSVKLPPSSSTSSMIAVKSQGINASVGSFDELGLGHHHHENVNAGLNSAGLFPGSQRWRDGGEGGEGGGGRAAALTDNFDGNKLHLISNYKFNCSASTSEFHHEKGLESIASGGEGTVGSWICPSD